MGASYLNRSRAIPLDVRISAEDLAGLNRRFEEASAEGVLQFVHATFGARAALLSSMQRAGTALARIADRAGLAFDVLFVDTGVLHQETLATRDLLAKTHKHLRVRTLAAGRSMEAQIAEEGVLFLTPEGQERCCDLRKSAPLRGVRGEYDALVGALRRAEGGARGRVSVFDIDPEMNALRVHPFATMPPEAFDAMLADDPGIVVNPLHKMGFPTIGCFPCTTPVRADEDDRAGRWRHLAEVRYCGINPTDRARNEPSTIDIDARYAAALGLRA